MVGAMLTTRVCTITDHLDALWPLLRAHRNELATHPEIMPLEPQTDVYRELEQRGKLLSLVLEHEGEIVGYSVNVISHNLHYGPLKVCQNDVIFVSSSWRSEGGGRQLISATEIAARELGCKMLLLHAKPGTRLDEILPAYGYAVQDVIHSRVL